MQLAVSTVDFQQQYPPLLDFHYSLHLSNFRPGRALLHIHHSLPSRLDVMQRTRVSQLLFDLLLYFTDDVDDHHHGFTELLPDCHFTHATFEGVELGCLRLLLRAFATTASIDSGFFAHGLETAHFVALSTCLLPLRAIRLDMSLSAATITSLPPLLPSPPYFPSLPRPP